MTSFAPTLERPLQRLGLRLGAAFGAVLLVTLAVAVAGMLQLWQVRAHNDVIATDTARLLQVRQWMELVQVNLDRALQTTRLDAAAADDDTVRSRLEPVMSRLAEDMAGTAKMASEVQESLQAQALPPTLRTAVEAVETRRSAFVKLRAGIRDDIQMGEPPTRIDGELVPLARDMVQALDALGTQLTQANQAASAALESDARRALWLLGLGTAGALLLGGVLAWRMTRSLTRPLRDAAELARAIEAGDLTRPVRADRADELGALVLALGRMQAQLRTLIGGIRRSAEGIATASAQVAGGSQDLSQRTEQAAANLQQTASSIEQLGRSVRDTAGSARSASSLAEAAAGVARRGDDVVAQVVGTMQQISESSRRIGEIIGTVDGIAFQTNILALNAAVEAARAGEAGRGFAVVAAEVRALAQRSAAAAREIKSLIGHSVERVEAGSGLAGQARSTMQEIVDSVGRVAVMIREIDEATTRQAQGIGEVNGTVGQLDRVTQSNAALVVQSAAAAASLKDQAAQLSQSVSVFRLGAA
jgi:methyl-accepting chemotaxis protein